MSLRHARSGLLISALAAGCAGPRDVAVGSFVLSVDKKSGTIDISHSVYGDVLEDVRFISGTGSASIEMQLGSFLFEDVTRDTSEHATVAELEDKVLPVYLSLATADDAPFGDLLVYEQGDGLLHLEFTPAAGDRVGFSADCDAQDHFLGTGLHAMDVDHVGQAFSLWVSEPGVGKVEDENPPSNWYQVGTRHATSYPVPFLMRPHRNQGLLLETTGRVDLDLCASGPRFEALAWHDGMLRVVVMASNDELDTLRQFSAYNGRPLLPPPWVFAPWVDAIRGSQRVREVVSRLRAFDAPVSAIWTEDWKGGEDSSYGYHLSPEWDLDATLYPDAVELAAELADDGIQWLAYFAPFIGSDSRAWDEAVAANAVITNEDGTPYTFLGVPDLTDTTMLDLTSDAGRAFALGKMQAARDIGFDGWMADYAEWLPTDAVLASGEDALAVHNQWPVLWQELNVEATSGDATFFARSGWAGAAGLAPVVWAGDQRTSFDTDDGFPTVVAMGLGAGASGVPYFSHDVAGYQSIGNDPSNKELWLRWAALAAYTPVMRTHHGAFEADNWQFDSDDETTEAWAELARQHTSLFPYLYAMAKRAADEGVPMLLPPALVYEDDYARTDAWLLGDKLLVAPVLEAGATGRDVTLPGGTVWYDWFTQQPAQGGRVESPLGTIPVFVAGDSIIPTFTTVPDTLVDVAGTVQGYADADATRTVYIFGDGGTFVEADGTTYTVTGTPTKAEFVLSTVSSGTIAAGDVDVDISGAPVTRAYQIVVTP
jgi:alpha-glucosidase